MKCKDFSEDSSNGENMSNHLNLYTSWFLNIPGIEESFHRHHLLTAALQVPNELTPATMVTDQQMDTPDGRKEARKFAKSNLVADFVWDG